MGKNSPSGTPGVSRGPRSKVQPAPAARPPAQPPTQPNVNARKKVDVAKDLVPQKAKQKEKYPEAVRNIKGKWGEYARAAVDIARENGMSLKDPLVHFAMVLCAFMGKYARYVDLIPGNFRKSLDKDKLAKEELTKSQKAKLRAQMLNEVPKDARIFFAMYKAENDKRRKEKKPVLDATETSTLYVSYLLFGASRADCMTDHKVLAARLSHEYTDLKRIKRTYGEAGFRALKKMDKIPRGTVIFFVPNFKTGIIAAYATGNRQEFVYFMPGSKDRKSFQLNSPTSPVKNELGLMAAFVPTNLQSAVAPTSAPTKTPSVNPDTLATSLTTTVVDAEKQLKTAMKQKNVTLKYTKVADVLANTISKVEDFAKKGKLLKPEQYAKIKEKYEKALKRYHVLITAVLKASEKERAGVLEQLTKLPAQIKDAIAKKKPKLAARLKIQLILAKTQKQAFAMIKPYLDKISEYLKRAKECLPKSISK